MQETALQIGHKEAQTECRLLSQEAHQLWEQEKEKMRGGGELITRQKVELHVF